jgi:hypothetical protein
MTAIKAYCAGLGPLPEVCFLYTFYSRLQGIHHHFSDVFLLYFYFNAIIAHAKMCLPRATGMFSSGASIGVPANSLQLKL